MKSRLRSLFIYIIAITLSTSGVLTIFSQNLYAEPLTFSKMKTDEKIASYAFYNGLVKCVNDSHVNKTASTIDDIFSNQQTIIDVGLLAETVASKSTPVSLGDGKMYCETIAKAAFKLWGLYDIDNATILNAFGYFQPSSKTYQCSYNNQNDNGRLVTMGEMMGNNDGNFPLDSIVLPDEYTTLQQYYFSMEQAKGDNDTLDDIEELANFCSGVPANGNISNYGFNSVKEIPTTEATYTLGIMGLLGYLEKNVFEITDSRNYSPSINDAHMYYLYKYYFQASDICGAKSYGLTSSLTDSIENQNIKNGTVDDTGNTYKYVTVKILDDDFGTASEYSFLMQGSKAVSGESFLTLNSTSMTCTDIVEQLGEYSTKVAEVLSNTTDSKYQLYAAIVGEAGLASAMPTGNAINDPTSSDSSGDATCGSTVTGIGWIVCPIINSLIALNDGAWQIVQGLLVVNPLNQTGSNNYIYQAWGIIRNIANIAFVIIFLIVIFSQITGFGIQNYGIKKLLPKIIVGAILVNLSFLIMQISVDISNIVGKSLYGLVLGATPNIPTNLGWSYVLNLITGGLGTGLAIGGFALVGGPATALYLLLPGLAMAALALVAAVFTLMFRQAAIPILVILAPLAFVAYLLPNTESWFKKWKKILIDALLLYPLAALVFSGARFAAVILIGDNTDWFRSMMGMVVLALPLGALPFIASKGGALTDAVLKGTNNMLGKLKSPINNFSKEKSDYTKAKFDNQAMNGRSGLFYGTRRMYMQQRLRQKTATQNFERQTGKANSEYVISELEKGPGSKSKLYKQMAMKGQPNNVIYNSAAAKYNASIISNAISEREAMNQKEIGSIVSEFNNRNAGFDEIKVEMLKAIKSGDMNRTRAMQNLLLNKGGAGKTALEDTYDSIYKGTKLSYIDKNGTTVDETLNSTYLTNGNQETIRLNQVLRSDLNAANIKASNTVLNKFASASSYATDIDTIANSVSTYQGLTPLELVGQSAKNFGRAIRAGVIDNATANLIATSPETRSKLDDDKWQALFIKFGITK